MKSYLTYEILDSIKRFFGSIIDFFTDTLFPRTKLGLLYPFAKSGVVFAQLSIANILFNHYWFWEPKNPEKWIEKGVEQNNSFAIVLKGHFCRYKARQIEDEESPASKKAAEEFVKNLENLNYKPDYSYEIESQKIWEEKEKRALPLFFELLDCYKKAAEMNFPMGQFYAYAMYDSYRYRLNLKPTGAKYLKMAAENGFPVAQCIFVQKCLEHNDLKNGTY